MIEIQIPGRETFQISHAVFDYNGTIAVDGVIPEDIKPLLRQLAELLPVTVLTADTYGTAKAQCEPLGLTVETFPKAGASACKEQVVKELGAENVMCFGNGFNDIPMFDACLCSVAVLDSEGLCAALLPHATILCRSMEEAVSLLLKPSRIVADLRT